MNCKNCGNKIKTLHILIIFVALFGYLFYQNIQLKKEVNLNRDIIEAHQYSRDLHMKQISDLHRITLDIIENTGVSVSNEITTQPY